MWANIFAILLFFRIMSKELALRKYFHHNRPSIKVTTFYLVTLFYHKIKLPEIVQWVYPITIVFCFRLQRNKFCSIESLQIQKKNFSLKKEVSVNNQLRDKILYLFLTKSRMRLFRPVFVSIFVSKARSLFVRFFFLWIPTN